ncbi:hypothetical protein CDL12_03071 [Handroanthus impetiginosus]|uniref:Uncharacterized protein n=1 Tax=Handroanthus impetiginosus TaxID=429701 RepID=A0A2G9I364_9LAMI|nr:hypothetical protein CDL12_03071 [Handroanthus impetiginosus]
MNARATLHRHTQKTQSEPKSKETRHHPLPQICNIQCRRTILVPSMNLEVEIMAVKQKRDIPIGPVVLKFGVAIAISLGGVLYTFLSGKRMKPPKSKPSGNESGELRDDDGALQDSSFRKISSQNSFSGRSSSVRHSGDREGLLLPEFNDLVKECNISVTIDDISPRKTIESLVSDVESPKEYKCNEPDEHEREIKRLQTMVKFLEERERNLEIQLFEYYGIKEQETAVMELQNRLRLNNMEAKLYNLKIESLLSDNRRLEEQVADYAKVVTELEAAKAKIKLLRKKLKLEAEQNREQILNLQDRVMKLQDQEQKSVEMNQDLEMQLKIKKELEEELEEMKKLNQSLKFENSDLAQKLEYVQMLATSALDNEEVHELKEESRRLKQRNEDLTKEIELLQADRCSDIEELVYLRRTNACLRYEISNYHSGGGKTIPRKSVEKAKQHVLENAHKEGSMEKGADITDFDSSSQASCLTDSGEHDDLSVDISSANKTKTKVFSKLKKLLRGKGSRDRTKTSPLQRTVSVDNIASRYSGDIASRYSCDIGADATLRNSSGCSSRRSFDLPRSYSRSQKSVTGESSSCSRRTSDDGSSTIFRRFDSLTEDDDWTPAIDLLHQDAQNDAENEMLKCDETRKNARAESFRRRSAPFGSS